MVGIPGKSKGCHTCRKRKIKCDLQQPDCQRCIRSGRSCEGYKRGAVFLNRTADGWTKRKRLEETRPRDDHERSPEESPTFSQATVSPPEQRSWPIIHVSDATVKKRMFQGLFLETYLPNVPKFSRGMQGAWLTEVVCLNNPGPALELALQALSITRVGRSTGHQDLIYRGKLAYGHALKALYTSLSNPKLVRKDETLAAATILGLYELFESTTEKTSQTATAHHEHMLGIDRLIQYRGPAAIKTPLGRAVMKYNTYGAMIRAIQFRRASRFKSLIDQVEWWDIQGKLFKKGHDVAELCGDLDGYKESGNHSLAASAELLKRCVQMDAELDQWYQELSNESPSPMFWKEGADAPPGARITFANVLLGQIIQDFWALKLVMTVTIAVMCSQVPPGVPVPFQKMIQALGMKHGDAAQVKLATDIMETMGYCMRDEHGLSSSQKCLFSGRVALYALRRQPPEHLERYEALFRDLSDKKGLRFAGDLTNQEMAKWTPVVAERLKPSGEQS